MKRFFEIQGKKFEYEYRNVHTGYDPSSVQMLTVEGLELTWFESDIPIMDLNGRRLSFDTFIPFDRILFMKFQRHIWRKVFQFITGIRFSRVEKEINKAQEDIQECMYEMSKYA